MRIIINHEGIMEGVKSPFSNYLYDIDPNKYFEKDKQEDYLQQAMGAVNTGLKDLQGIRGSQRGFHDAFYGIWRKFSNIRNKIAAKHGTDDNELFGLSRLKVHHSAGSCGTTPLTDAYAEYNNLCQDRIRVVLRSMKYHWSGFTQNKTEIDGRKFSLTVEVMNKADVRAKAPELAEIQKALGQNVTFRQLAVQPELPKRIYERNIEIHNRAHLSGRVAIMKWAFPDIRQSSGIQFLVGCTIAGLALNSFDFSPVFLAITLITVYAMALLVRDERRKTHYVLTTVGLQINEKRNLPLGGHLTWMQVDGLKDPIEDMRGRSITFVMHQDVYLINETMKEIAKMFEACILWDKGKQTIRELKDRVAMFRFVYAYCMPNYRGDGAIGDWMEILIYRFHDFPGAHHNSETLPCFEPLSALTFEQYQERYGPTIEIEE